MAAAAEQPFGPGPFARMAASSFVDVSTYIFLPLPCPAGKRPTARPRGMASTDPTFHHLGPSSHSAWSRAPPPFLRHHRGLLHGRRNMLGALLLTGAMAGAAIAGAPPAAPAVAPTPIFRSYGVAEGLPSTVTYAVTQDHTGYIWIGTHAGLVRYDSRTFKVFRYVPDEPASLPANDVSALLVDRSGRLWVGGEGTGLNLYRPASGGFRHWMHAAAQPDSLGANDVMAIAQDKSGAIWVGVFAGGLNRLDQDGKGFAHWHHVADDPASLASNSVISLAAASDGGLWIGTDAGLDRMSAQGKIRLVELPGLATQPSIWQVRVADAGVDAATSAGLFHIDDAGHATRVGPAREAFASLRGDDGSVWIAERGGLDRIGADGVSRFEQPIAGVAGTVPGRLPDGLFRDHEGGLWVATMDGGLAYLSPQWQAFSMFRNVPGDPASLARNRVRALALAGNGDLWVGSAGMLDRLDPATGAVTHVPIPDLGRMSISALAEDASGRLWIGSRRGCFVWNGKHLQPVAAGDPALRHGVRRLLVARNGTIYVAGNGTGVYRVDPQTLTFQPLAPPAAGEAAQEILQMREAMDGSIWVASHAGLARLAPGANAFAFVPGVATSDIQAFAFGPDDTLWAARTGSLQHYRLGEGRAERVGKIGSMQGWPDTNILGMQVDKSGRVFALGVRNLVVYDPHRKQLLTFALAEGLATTDFTGDELLATRQGQLFAGSLDGVIGIHPAPLLRHLATPKVALESVEVRRNGKRIALDPAKPIDLDWRDRELTVTVRVLSFIDPGRNQYRFRLQGFDPGWVDTGIRDVREFSVLEPGNYRLLISGRTGDGPWSAAVDALSLDVRAAPWVTPWAKLGYVLLAILLAAWATWAMRRRFQQKHRLALSEERQQLAEQANAAKSRFLANMAHEIRTPLTGVLGMTELLLKTPLDDRQHQYADAIRRSGALLLRQVNDALDVARIEAGRLELNQAPFDPAAILREVAEADAGLAAQKQLALDVAVAPDAPRAVRGDALRVQQILLNLTHNALKFTTHGSVTLKLERDGGGIVYRVVDSGPGMTPEECARIFRRFEQADHGRLQRGSGLGLAISRELVGLMGGRIDVQSVPGRGSTFNVYLPLAAVIPESAAEMPAPRDDKVSLPQPRLSTSTQARVLLVEDDPVAGQAIAGLIETFGYTVTVAPQALAALSETETGDAFDAMVFDFDLPGMDGCELARLLRQRGVAAPIVALTASAHGDEEQRARAAGMNAFVRKPVLPEDLREALQGALQKPA
ncbi:MAG: hybrid sensor histidine kinase/response regulator [Rhodanobacteraceae bacterium]|nr:MAG: hybrid sensor histidine kinase/response regulator [Rhodanobacteraceae bacterium]